MHKTMGAEAGRTRNLPVIAKHSTKSTVKGVVGRIGSWTQCPGRDNLAYDKLGISDGWREK